MFPKQWKFVFFIFLSTVQNEKADQDADILVFSDSRVKMSSSVEFPDFICITDSQVCLELSQPQNM